MTDHLDILCAEASRWAAQIASLAVAANCVFSGSAPADKLVRENAVLNILDVIEELAGHAEHSIEQVERTLRERVELQNAQ